MATLVVGFTSSLSVLFACRLVLGIMEGIYWPQQSRFARAWFAPEERTLANSAIQYLRPVHRVSDGLPDPDAYLCRIWLAGGVLGHRRYRHHLCPAALSPSSPPGERGALRRGHAGASREAHLGKRSAAYLSSFLSSATSPKACCSGGLRYGFLLLCSRWASPGRASHSPVPCHYFAALALTYPMAKLSDRTGKRVLIVALGQILPGALLLLLPQVDNPTVKLALITVAMGYYASSYTPNIWSILQGGLSRKRLDPPRGS